MDTLENATRKETYSPQLQIKIHTLAAEIITLLMVVENQILQRKIARDSVPEVLISK